MVDPYSLARRRKPASCTAAYYLNEPYPNVVNGTGVSQEQDKFSATEFAAESKYATLKSVHSLGSLYNARICKLNSIIYS
jgi:hypothetical protein